MEALLILRFLSIFLDFVPGSIFPLLEPIVLPVEAQRAGGKSYAFLRLLSVDARIGKITLEKWGGNRIFHKLTVKV
jgi:hypothetical protein